ncbi:MAG: hypothetical protein J7L41_08750 [Synergistetes bacterium]|nr:hypothetical protein [Synergistota bacterium]
MQMLKSRFFIVVGIVSVCLAFGIFYFTQEATLYGRKLKSARDRLNELQRIVTEYKIGMRVDSVGKTDLFTLLSKVAKDTGLGGNLVDVTPSGDRGYIVRLNGIDYKNLVTFLLYMAEHYSGVGIESMRIKTEHGKHTIDVVIVVSRRA